jgi:hypothetical protein
MVRQSRNTELLSNELYRNGFGIVVLEGARVSPNTLADNLVTGHAADGLLLIAASPIVRHNRVLQNAHAGLRLASLTRGSGERRDADPLLEGNVLQGNGWDEPYRDEYVSAGDAIPAPAQTDCSWRLAAVTTASVQRVP